MPIGTNHPDGSVAGTHEKRARDGPSDRRGLFLFFGKAGEVDWQTFLERFGLPVALVVFFVITGWKREQRVNVRLDKQDEYITNTLTKMVGTMHQALTENTQVMSRLERWLEKHDH